MYRTENGVASIMLDDDNCDWYTTLSIGHGMCGSSSGHSGIYGVDLLFDEKGSPSPGYGLTLYFRGEYLFHVQLS